ncbi:helix-turn-helix domain-containing protein [Nocardioides sp. J54]|uniref:helix-turn-helix domain-containing protein n=1 Tax=Nocardioides sp. J54 TaxID=935866 RepID=UPI00048C639C|nr:helix-turn-helix domain-containing protein [Nocardioides sp. J54]
MSRPVRISLKEAAEILDVSVETVRRWIAAGDLPAERIGKRLLKVNRSDVEALAQPVPTGGDQ